MIIQVYTQSGIIELNTPEDFIQYGLDIKDYFDVDQFLLGLMEAFTPLVDYSNILPFYPMVADFARAKNFVGMNMFLQGLIQDGIMTQEQFDKLNNVLLQQNIDLNNL